MARRAKAKQRKVKTTLGRIGRIGLAVGAPATAVALALVRKRRRKIERVLKRKGIKPAEKDGNLAIQAAQVVERDGINKAMEMGLAPSEEELTPEQIEMGVEESQEQEELNIENDPENEADSFDPATLGAVFGAAKGAVTKINANRQAAGKRPLLRGKKWAARQKAGGAKTASTADVLKGAADEVVAAKKSDEINKLLPLIIIVAIALFMLGKNLK